MPIRPPRPCCAPWSASSPASTRKPRACEQAARELVVELEQAGDSANVAAKADMGASADSRKAVDIAHNSICVLKFETKPA